MKQVAGGDVELSDVHPEVVGGVIDRQRRQSAARLPLQIPSRVDPQRFFLVFSEEELPRVERRRGGRGGGALRGKYEGKGREGGGDGAREGKGDGERSSGVG